jgi:hypothetical protein
MPVIEYGDVHGTYVSPSKLHSNVTSVSVAVNVAVAVESSLNAMESDVSGAMVSTRQETLAGDCSTLPPASIAHTAKVYVPSDRSLYVTGDSQGEPPSPFSVHINVAASFEEKRINASRLLTTLEGAESMEVTGGVVSTTHDRVAGVWSTFPAASIARTSRV